MKIQVGDRVRLSSKFLRSTGQYTGEAPFARGTVTSLKTVGRNGPELAKVDWNDGDGSKSVLVSNLEKC